MGEQAGTPDHAQAGVGEGVDHLLGPLEREEWVVLTPHELHGDLDPLVHGCQVVDEPDVEVAKQACSSVAACAYRAQGFEEELLELAVE
jgi:hypothetical protein